MAENSIKDIKDFFGVQSANEFQEFWKSLSEEDKAYYKSADLS